MELEFAGGLFGTSSLDGLEIVTRVNYYLRSKQSRRCVYVSPVSPASTVHIKPRVVGDATKEHPYRMARVSSGVEFYRGAAAAGRCCWAPKHGGRPRIGSRIIVEEYFAL